MLNRFRKMPISRQLSITAGASIILFSIILTALTSTLISRQLRENAMTDAQLQTEQFAERALFAFLVDDPSVAEQAISSITSFPTIEYAALVRADGALVAASTDDFSGIATFDTSPRHLTQIREERGHWLISAPVIASPEPATIEDQKQAAEYIGAVTLAFL